MFTAKYNHRLLLCLPSNHGFDLGIKVSQVVAKDLAVNLSCAFVSKPLVLLAYNCFRKVAESLLRKLGECV